MHLFSKIGKTANSDGLAVFSLVYSVSNPNFNNLDILMRIQLDNYYKMEVLLKRPGSAVLHRGFYFRMKFTGSLVWPIRVSQQFSAD